MLCLFFWFDDDMKIGRPPTIYIQVCGWIKRYMLMFVFPSRFKCVQLKRKQEAVLVYYHMRSGCALHDDHEAVKRKGMLFNQRVYTDKSPTWLIVSQFIICI